MLIKGLVDEDFVNYKLPSMYIATATCSFKCDKEYGQPICQNSELVKQPTIDVPIDQLIGRYVLNPITNAVVFGGLEPFDQIEGVVDFILKLRRSGCHDDIVVYTGYKKEELQHIKITTAVREDETPHPWMNADLIKCIQQESWIDNIIIKYGRYIPNQQPHYDPVLGVYLASDNQYAERIS